MEKGLVIGRSDASIAMRSQTGFGAGEVTEQGVRTWKEDNPLQDQPQKTTLADSVATQHSTSQSYHISETLAIPQYLEQTYWWAYLHPKGVRFFERQWLVNLILWGNFSRLRDVALAEMGSEIHGHNLQVACVYGDFTPRVANRLSKDARLEVVDVAPVQLENVRHKLKNCANVRLHHQDSSCMTFQDDMFDNVIVFFLLHEQPEEIRKKTVSEAMRVVKPGGKVIFVDYHRPSLFNPFRYIMIPILRALEPFALALWKQDIVSWLPTSHSAHGKANIECRKETFFGGLYQKVVLEPDASACLTANTQSGSKP